KPSLQEWVGGSSHSGERRLFQLRRSAAPNTPFQLAEINIVTVHDGKRLHQQTLMNRLRRCMAPTSAILLLVEAIMDVNHLAASCAASAKANRAGARGASIVPDAPAVSPSWAVWLAIASGLS